VRAPGAQVGTEHPQRPQGHGPVQQPEEKSRAHQAQLRHQQQREGQRHQQRAQVVEGQHLADEFAQAGTLAARFFFQDAHHQRDLQAHQAAHQQHQRIEQHAKWRLHARGQQAVRGEETHRQQTAQQGHQQLHPQELRHQLTLHETAQVGADAQGEQIAADDGAELQHRVAEQVGGQAAGGQLVGQSAGSDQEDAGQQQGLGGRDPVAGLAWARSRPVRARDQGAQ
jgi:hypothetical protein